MARQFLIWEADEDLPASDWVQEVAHEIWRDLARPLLKWCIVTLVLAILIGAMLGLWSFTVPWLVRWPEGRL